MRRLPLLAVLTLSPALCVSITADPARADLIAADAFLIGSDAAAGEYATAALATNADGGQNPTVAGFTGAWGKNALASSQFRPTSEVVSFDHVSYPAGGSLLYTDAYDVTRLAQRELASYTPADTYYMSGIIRRGNLDDGADGLIYMGFGSRILDSQVTAAAANVYGLHWGLQGNAQTGSADLVMRHRAGLSQMNNVVLYAGAEAGIDYLVLVRVDINTSGGKDTVTYWINPSDLSSESAATATALATGSFASYAMNVNTDLTHLNLAASAYKGGFVRLDEPRLATTFDAVTGAIPEPASATLLVALGSLVIQRRRTVRWNLPQE